MKHIVSRILFAVAVVAFAFATSAQENVVVRAQVLKSCSTTGNSEILIVDYDPNAAAPAAGVGSVTVQCTKGTTYYWHVDNGVNLDPGVSRRMASTLGPTEYLAYSLAGTAAGVTTNAPIDMVGNILGQKSTGRALAMTLSLAATPAALQDLSTDKGDFTDTIVVSVDIAP